MRISWPRRKRAFDVILVIVISLLAFGVWLLTSPSTQNPIHAAEGQTTRFPNVQTSNLNNEAYSLPADFASAYNVVVLPYTEAQQNEVNTWLDFLNQLRAEYPISVYEIPVMEQYSRMKQLLINAGMSVGIADAQVRRDTLPLYTDVAAFNQPLGLSDTTATHVLLVDRGGVVYWRGSGVYSEALGTELRGRIRSLQK